MQASGKSSGWVTFAAIMMIAVGFVRIIAGISYLADSVKVNDYSLGLFGDNAWAWGIWDLGIAAVALLGGWSLLMNGPFGRLLAYIWAIAVIVQGFMTFNESAWYSAAAILIAVLVIHGLTKTREESTA